MIQNLYHISYKNKLENQTLKPRKPESMVDGYESPIPRVCFTDSIDNCLKAVVEASQKETYHVYIADGNLDNIYSNLHYPDEMEVFDANITNEVWCLTEVHLKYIGEIVVNDVKLINHKSNNPIVGEFSEHICSWKWIQKVL